VTIVAMAAAAKSPSAWDQPGTLGFLVVFGMAVILYFVFRSLVKQLKKINNAARLEAEQAAAAEADGMHAPDSPADLFTDRRDSAPTPPAGGQPLRGDGTAAAGQPLADRKIIGPPAGNGLKRND